MPSAPLRTIAKLVYVGFLLAFVSFGTLNVLVKIVDDTPLFGVEQDAKKPTFSFDAVRKETYQHDFTAWFEQRWGLRGVAVRSDNTLVRSVFRETRKGPAIVGRNGVLISEEDLFFVNRADDPGPTVAQAKNIARVQAKMRRRGKVLVPVIIPAKTSFFRTAVPSEWRRRGSYERSDLNLYSALVATLSAENAKFVDGRALLTTRSPRPEEIFAPTGRHWRMSAGCRVLQAVIDLARSDLPEIGDDQFDCTTRVDPNPSVEDEDYDLFRLLNVWNEKPKGMDVEVLVAPKAPASLKVPTLFVGSSFMWKFVRVSRELEIMQPSLFYYYDASVVETTTMMITKKVEPFTDDWRKDTFSKRLFVVGMLETYIPADGERFFAELEKELDSSP